MSLMFALWLSFISKDLLAQAANTTRNDTNMLLGKAADTTLMLEKLLDGYDKRLRPNFGGSPCKVNISIQVLSMVPIKEIDMEATVVMFFRQHWIDPRLAYGPSLGIQKMKLLGNIVEQVWLPDIYFVNDLSDKTACGDFMFELTQDGLITHSCRRKLRLYCPMNLRKFPMDEQVCEMAFESYSYSTKDLILYWLNDNKGPVRVSENLRIPQYTLVNWENTIQANEYSTGNFTSMSTKFHLQRQLGHYVLQEFIPTILIVALSWVGFWIDERSVPARVSLGITTVLAITTLMFGVQSTLPRVGHVKAIDVFLLGSFLFVFAALVEFAIICSFTKLFSVDRELSKEKRFLSSSAIFEDRNDVETGCTCKENGNLNQGFENKQDESKAKDRGENYHPSLSFTTVFSKSSTSRLFRKPARANSVNLPKHASRPFNFRREPCTIDKHSRKLFPLAYALYLSIYFAVYCFADV
ncbi:gamma-aminobutyric acid receptor subunit beta-like [Oculina patagonica]